MSANDKQIGGTHYKKSIEPWDAIHSWDLGYFDGTAVKYLARWKAKNGVQDLEKAKHFIEKLIEIETSGTSSSENLFNYSHEMGNDWSTPSKESTSITVEKLLNLYYTFEDMHQHAKDKHNHFKVASNLVKRTLEDIGHWLPEEDLYYAD